jgi:nicotinamidase-related amidase
LPQNSVHLCVDMQRMFLEATDWQLPSMPDTLPAIEALVDADPARTVFTRFIPPPTEATQGAWVDYYAAWPRMAREAIAPELLGLAPSLAHYTPPARVFDKPVFSPWWSGELHRLLQQAGIDTVIVSGGETDVCVLATIMGAIDLGYRVWLPTDAVCSSAESCHEAMLSVFESRFGVQVTTCTTDDILAEKLGA